jgi:hypothetical protein
MKDHSFDSYRDRYENVRMKREEGILEVAHTRDGPRDATTSPRRRSFSLKSSIKLTSSRWTRFSPGSMRQRRYPGGGFADRHDQGGIGKKDGMTQGR